MTTTPNRQKRGVPRWVWVLAGLVVAIALVVGVSVVFAKNRATTTTPAPTPSPSAATSGADGCIAGRDNDAKSLIAGARKQGQSDAGAAATAAGLFRFMFQYPWPKAHDLELMMRQLSTVDDAEIASTAEALRETPGPKEARTAGYSIAEGRYVIEPGSTSTSVVVSVSAGAITDGQLNGETLTKTFTMVWQDDVWQLDGSNSNADDGGPADAGVAFVGGC